jgi:hypothetical protein
MVRIRWGKLNDLFAELLAMTALVPELVNMASDPAVSTTELLRRALVVANRLNVPEIVSWIDFELNGYKENVPNYRMIRGQLVAEHPQNGLIPFLLSDNEIAEKVTEHHESQSIPELEMIHLCKDNEKLVKYFSANLENKLMNSMRWKMRPQLMFSPVQIKGIIEKVRNQLLQWALDLENRGILGEGLSFTQQEKQIVQAQHYHFDNVSGSQIQISSNGSNQTQANTVSYDVEAIKAAADKLSTALDQSRVSGDAIEELRAELLTLKAQASSPKPKWEMVKASVRCIKTIVEGAAGSVLGELAKPYVAPLLALVLQGSAS